MKRLPMATFQREVITKTASPPASNATIQRSPHGSPMASSRTSTATTAIYARFGEDTVRAALEQHGARIMGAAGLTPEAEVTEIGTRRKA